MDEVQAGFGRTGKMFTFEHYGIVPDIITCGKGISSSLPISAVIGRKDLMEQYKPGEMTITHSGSPLPVAATVANIKLIQGEKLVERAARFDGQLREGLMEIQQKYPDRVPAVRARGLVGGVLLGKPGSTDPDGETAMKISERCLEKGLLMFAPVGLDHECIKICPPLTIPEEALTESLAVLDEAFDEILG
jgi:4-aminobutyrate aminotransferase/diaminobutyrate-pyruvate transaminase/4-aminobutyrate aminotransferase/(S)-3-amino-2-methylpropionate transaminase